MFSIARHGLLRGFGFFSFLLLLACSDTPTTKDVSGGVGPAGETLVYECGDYEFIARTGPGEIALYLPEGYRVLGQVGRGPGLRYSDEDVSFRRREGSASLDVGARRYRDCVLNPSRVPWEEARRRGVDFRAVGQEPGWELEIKHEQNMLFVGNYGSRRVLLPTPEPELLEGAEHYRVSGDGHRMSVLIELEYCTDSMSGAAFDSRVRVELDGSVYQGCGMALQRWWD